MTLAYENAAAGQMEYLDLAAKHEYLSGLDNAFMIVSHDHTFLEKIANRICAIDNDTITKYYGTYSELKKRKPFCGKIMCVMFRRKIL